MIESTDWLCQKHFNKTLIDKNVEILDPAAGTGTFITELIEHFRGQPKKLRHKYLEELHANEVAILLLRRQFEHRGDLCRDQRLRGISESVFCRYARQHDGA
jgi:hypothetical protein